MTYTYKTNIFYELMDNFIKKKTTPSEFQQSYMRQWNNDTQKQREYITTEINDAINAIIIKLRNQKISEKQYRIMRNEILGISETDKQIIDIIDRGYTTCDVYWEDATENDIKNGQLDDEGLIKEITQIYEELKELLKNENSI